MIQLDPVKYSHHYINPAAPKAIVSETYYQDIQDAYISRNIRRDKEIRKYFEGSIAPVSVQKSIAIDDMVSYALDLYSRGKNEHFKTHEDTDNKTIYEYETKQQGLKKVTIVNVFENGVLKRKIEITPDKSIKAKEFKGNINQYDYYEANFSSGKRIFKENVREKNDGFSSKIFADKIFEYEGSFLKKYEEGYSSVKINGYPQIKIKKRFKPNYNAFIVNYFENLSKDSLFKREKSEFQADAPFKRFQQD